MTVKAKFGFGAAGGALAIAWLLLLTVSGYPARAADPAPAAAAPPPPAVTVAKPVFKSSTEWDDYTGRFIAKERVDVRARVSGYLESVHFKEGQMIAAGELLFILDQRPFETQVARAKAEVDRANTQLRVGQLEFERGERLQSSRAMSKETTEERRAKRDAAQAEVDAAKAALRNAELNLSFAQVRAPMAGRLSDIRTDVGNLISGGSADSTVLTTIVSLDPIEFEIEASEAEFLRYTRLDTAGTRPSSRDVPNRIEAQLIDETDWVHKGNMTFVDNEIDSNSDSIRGHATFPNPDHVLLPGMFARARLFGAGEHQAVMVPDVAVVADQARKLVMVLGKDNIIEARVVTLGPVIDGLRVVREGLTADERIVVNGIIRAHPGKPVTPTETTVGADGTIK